MSDKMGKIAGGFSGREATRYRYIFYKWIIIFDILKLLCVA